jgi:ATP-binding cassette subfamily B protein
VSNVNEFLSDFPMKLMTSIGRGGWQLSAGQKQRVLIARALYRDPEILIFDEATSALDSRNENAITEQLSEAFKNKTSIIISHRMSTIKDADQIVVLDNGKIVEIGTHHDLARRETHYGQLFGSQIW